MGNIMDVLSNINNGPFGPVIDELENLVPMYPNTGNPKEEAIYFSYEQARIAYYFLCNLLQQKSQVIGIYIYAWSIIDNADRYSKLTNAKIDNLRNIRNAFQHVDEKLNLYKTGSIPVFGSISYFLKKRDGQPEFGIFPERIGRPFCSCILHNTQPYHDGISHLTLSALKSDGRKGNDASQQVIRLDSLVLKIGHEVCSMFGKKNDH